MFSKHFSFVPASSADAIAVSASARYSEETGYGFLYEMKYDAPAPFQPLLQGGWRIAPENEPLPEEAPNGAMLCAERFPLRFRAAVPHEGIYRVTVRIQGGENGVKQASLFTMHRNLIQAFFSVAPGEVYERSFTVRVCPYYPDFCYDLLEDNSIYVSVTGTPAVLSEIIIEETDAPTVFVAGDSTVTDQMAPAPYYPRASCGGWAQTLLRYFDDLALCSHAHSGMTGNCYRDDGHWDLVAARMRPGDIFLMQFGHNDQKRRNLQALGGYAANLRWFIAETRKRGGIPVIVSPFVRQLQQDSEGIFDALEDYAYACRKVGAETGTFVIDNHSASFAYYEAQGHDTAAKYYMPGDPTHGNDIGAMKMADLILADAIRQGIEPLASHARNVVSFGPEIDDVLPQLNRPFRGGGKRMKADRKIYLRDIAGHPKEQALRDASLYGLIDLCVAFAHPDDVMPRLQSLFVLSSVLGIAAIPGDGTPFADIPNRDWYAGLVRAAVSADLLDPAFTNAPWFRPDDPLTGRELISMMMRACAERLQKDASFPAEAKEILDAGKDLDYTLCRTIACALGLPVFEDEAAALTRADMYEFTVAVIERLNENV